MYAIIIPVYNNEGSIPALLEALEGVAKTLAEKGTADVKMVFVTDGSPDSSAEELAKRLPDCAFQSELLTHSRNFGSFAAIRTGLGAVNADYYGMIAADLQEPPELLIQFHDILVDTASDVVVGVRSDRDDPAVDKAFSGAFWGLYRHLVMPSIPRGGVDLFGCTRQVRDNLLKMSEANSSLVAQLFWLGYTRTQVPYARNKRQHGKSGWSIRKKLSYMMDSIFAFTDLPLKLITASGLLAMLAAVTYGGYVLYARAIGAITDPGFAATVIAVLFMGGLNAFALGIVGNYAWRTFENSKRRPLSVVSSQCSFPALTPKK